MCEPEGGWKTEDATVVCRQLGHCNGSTTMMLTQEQPQYLMQQEMLLQDQVILAIQ